MENETLIHLIHIKAEIEQEQQRLRKVRQMLYMRSMANSPKYAKIASRLANLAMRRKSIICLIKTLIK